MMKKYLITFFLLLVFIAPGYASHIHRDLRDGWLVQVGSETFRTALPATAMGILVDKGIYRPDSVKGIDYSQVDKARLTRPWLFRNRFKLDELGKSQRAFLKLEGLNYSANVLVNGKLIVRRDAVKGAHSSYYIDVTNWISTENELTIQVFKKDNADSYLMGILGGASIEIVDEVAIQHVSVTTKVSTAMRKEAWVSIEAQLVNYSASTVKGALVGKTLDNVSFYLPVTLKGGEKRTVRFDSNNTPKLHVVDPRLWWCNGMGAPELYNLSIEFDIESKVCDSEEISYPIRSISGNPVTGVTLNGKAVSQKKFAWSEELWSRVNESTYGEQMSLAKKQNDNVLVVDKSRTGLVALQKACDRNGVLLFASPAK